MNHITECTKNCPREDCCIIEGASTSTLMGWTPTYDKNGNRTDRGDPNILSTEMQCTVCGNRWSISRQYGEVTISINELKRA